MTLGISLVDLVGDVHPAGAARLFVGAAPLRFPFTRVEVSWEPGEKPKARFTVDTSTWRWLRRDPGVHAQVRELIASGIDVAGYDADAEDIFLATRPSQAARDDG